MKFVAAKTADQLDLQALHWVRERLVSQRTASTAQVRQPIYNNAIGRAAFTRSFSPHSLRSLILPLGDLVIVPGLTREKAFNVLVCKYGIAGRGDKCPSNEVVRPRPCPASDKLARRPQTGARHAFANRIECNRCSRHRH